ncbi:hypothetical protein GOFOIKOB_6148 [Methylobacterium tardum]|uniref:Uncharacterized protein n=1 Tax=Methylobacterium tardum TaxID=374432 RepID=A0AA37TCP7_9HYPH|nr:hypothetical protein [Methylobacterium tardum]GJE53072.1 hypothetical protein GOFOIKOB_6148 [Methylobacterium tardum]GLS68723.1 hypothetical protein GCM10007890_07350 [Methylobacterium tardum]
MDRSMENVMVVATTQPPRDAIKQLNLWRKESKELIEEATVTIKAEQTFQAGIGSVIAKLEGIMMGAPGIPIPEKGGHLAPEQGDEDVEDQGAAPQFEIPEFSWGNSIEGKILEALGDGPKTIRETMAAVVAKGADTNWHGVYNVMLTGRQSLVRQGLILFDNSIKPGRARLNPDYVPPAQPYDDFVGRIHELDDTLEPKHKPVVELFAEGLKLHTIEIRKNNGGKRLHANRTWNLVRDKGLIGAIETIVTGPETLGYSTMIKIGRADLLAEKIVIDHPHLFSDVAVEAAQRRWKKMFPDEDSE